MNKQKRREQGFGIETYVWLILLGPVLMYLLWVSGYLDVPPMTSGPFIGAGLSMAMSVSLISNLLLLVLLTMNRLDILSSLMLLLLIVGVAAVLKAVFTAK